MSDNNTKALDDRMMRLQVALDEALNSANRRKSNSLVFMVISLIALSFYLMVAYYKVAEFDSNTVILNLENYTRQQIDASRPMLTKQLIAYAPQATDQLEALIRQAPAELTSQLRMSIDRIVADALPDLEGELYAHISEALAEAHDAMPKSADGTVDEAVFRKAMDDIAASYAKEVHAMVDKIHALYIQRSTEVLASLDHLAKGQQLDPSQQHLRAAMVSFLQLMEHWDP
ncbi:MAG TPA: hypothetical protein DER01_08985, partial [Phycisphaerales bacterium]|nr:hypothetical protein [Phycisphaerales bacterium]